MKIIVDENITYGREAFSTLGNVFLIHGREITRGTVIDADALIVRSITEVNKKLLERTNVKFVGTATIGTDHIDVKSLKENNIRFASAAGCNSWAVTEYIFSAIEYIINKHHISLENKSIGVIGIGNIGSKVSNIAKVLGLRVVKNDPPLQRQTNNLEYKTLDEALSCDIITLHVPLNLYGIDKTHHLINEENISLIKPGTILINTSRGAVVDNSILLKRLKEKNDIYAVLDVWENEPNIANELLALSEIGTAHVAGYSFEGKVNGTIMIYEALCNYLNTKKLWQPKFNDVCDSIIEINEEMNVETILNNIFSKTFAVKEDDLLLREGLNLSERQQADHFDKLRKEYRYRRELSNYFVKRNNPGSKFNNLFSSFRMREI